jgi:hypothetical protein
MYSAFECGRLAPKTIGIVAVAAFAARAEAVPPGGSDYRHLTGGEIGCHRREFVVLTVRPTVFDRYMLPLDKAYLPEPLTEG